MMSKFTRAAALFFMLLSFTIGAQKLVLAEIFTNTG